MFLKKSGHSQVDLSIPSKKSFPTKGSFTLQCPHIDLLLAIGKRAMAWIPAFLFSSNICNDNTEYDLAFTQLLLEIHLKTSLSLFPMCLIKKLHLLYMGHVSLVDRNKTLC